MFSVRVTVAHPAEPDRAQDIDLVVDTGSTFTWISRDLADRLELPRVMRLRFRVADGRTIERNAAGAMVRVAGRLAAVTVVLADEGDAHMLGATTLESLGFGVDPVRQQLVPQPLFALLIA